MEQNISTWNSLEVAKLLVSLFTPIIVAYLTVQATRALNRIEDRQKEHLQRVERLARKRERIVEDRFALYREFGTKLNDIYIYFQALGDFRSFTPDDIIQRKRELDRIRYTYEPLFTRGFRDLYDKFMKTAFSTYSGFGQPALICADVERLKAEWRGANQPWDDLWDKRFGVVAQTGAVRDLYLQLLSQLASELDLNAEDEQES